MNDKDRINTLSWLLAIFTVIFLALTMSGCAARTATDAPATDLPYGVNRFVDAEADVVCWRFNAGYSGGLSCLPLGDTALAAEEPAP